MQMPNEKLTAKKVLAIIGLTAIGTVALITLYWIILFFSLPITGNATVSLVLALSITLGIPLVLFVGFKRRAEREQKE